MRRATQSDVKLLVELMSEYYRESNLYIDVGRASWAFSQLLSDQKTGRIWLVEDEAHPVGYVVMTFGFSIAAGGLTAFIDDLFIQSRYRRRGLGRAAVDTVLDACESLGVRTLSIELPPHNLAAQGLYQAAGFFEEGHSIRTRQLAPPAHR